jgi:hypothetical protein
MSKITVNEFEGGAQVAREARRGATRREFLTGAGAALGAVSVAAMLPGRLVCWARPCRARPRRRPMRAANRC